MNFQRNLIYIALGAAIMFLGMSSTRRPDATFDRVECRKLVVVDEASNSRVIVSTNENGGIIAIYDVDDQISTQQVGLLIDKHGGAILVNGNNGTINLLTDEQGGIVAIGDKADRTKVVLQTYEDGGNISVGGKDAGKVSLRGRGTIHTYDKDGNVTGSLPPHPHPHSDTEEE